MTVSYRAAELPIVAGMSNEEMVRTVGTEAAAAAWFADWHAAEDDYAEALVRVFGTGPGAPGSRDWAVELARLRARADRARDRYFRMVLG